MGHACLVAGAVGLFVPLLPTTPLVLLAAFCYSKGSRRLHRWLTAHPRYGAPIRDWQRDGVIRPRAKWISTLLIVASLGYPLLFKDLPIVVKLIVGLIGVGVLTFLHSRPSHAAAPLSMRESAGEAGHA